MVNSPIWTVQYFWIYNLFSFSIYDQIGLAVQKRADKLVSLYIYIYIYTYIIYIYVYKDA